MLRRAVGLVFLAAGALVADALLLPPGIAASSDHHHGRNTVFDPKSQSVDLPYPLGTPGSRLHLHFHVADDDRHLQLNGTSIFPFDHDAHSDGFMVHLPAASPRLVGDDAADPALAATPDIIPFRFHRHQDHRASDHGDSINTIELELAAHDFTAPARVLIDLLRLVDGELLILRVQTVTEETFEDAAPAPYDPLSSLPPPDFPFSHPPMSVEADKDCDLLPASLCRLRAMLEAQLARLQFAQHGSHRFSPHDHDEDEDQDGNERLDGSMVENPFSPAPAVADSLPPPPPSTFRHGRPHHMRPYGEQSHDGHDHHHHHHHHHESSPLATFARGLVAVLIPVVAGITVGLAISLVGLMVGRLVTFLWTRVVRGSSRQGAACARRKYGRCRGHADDDEPLPKYEEAPAYEPAPAYEG